VVRVKSRKKKATQKRKQLLLLLLLLPLLLRPLKRKNAKRMLLMKKIFPSLQRQLLEESKKRVMRQKVNVPHHHLCPLQERLPQRPLTKKLPQGINMLLPPKVLPAPKLPLLLALLLVELLVVQSLGGLLRRKLHLILKPTRLVSLSARVDFALETLRQRHIHASKWNLGLKLLALAHLQTCLAWL